ncbi:MAG TPA: DNA-binding response regulator [Flavobacteriales bacterium]|jgi:two-component system, LytTR family, response regulator|nr:response regulator transcription factor [Flavobacteriales bacterium]HAW18915.1 DNA-binding response regulator [Flavobacteriales bacterium]
MKKIRALIVDDEELARENLKFLLADYCPNVQVEGTASSAKEAVRFLKTNNIDLLLLDIEMPNGSGFELLESLQGEIDFKIIFITAYHEYALKAFKFSAVDYLLKPINPEDLEAAIGKISPGGALEPQENIQALIENMNSKSSGINKIALASMEGLQFVDLSEIVYCESQDNYTQFFLVDGSKIMVSKTIKYYEEVLDSSKFFRVHRSNIINLSFIDKYVKGEGGYVVLKQGARIPVSRRRKESFLQLFQYQ